MKCDDFNSSMMVGSMTKRKGKQQANDLTVAPTCFGVAPLSVTSFHEWPMGLGPIRAECQQQLLEGVYATDTSHGLHPVVKMTTREFEFTKNKRIFTQYERNVFRTEWGTIRSLWRHVLEILPSELTVPRAIHLHAMPRCNHHRPSKFSHHWLQIATRKWPSGLDNIMHPESIVAGQDPKLEFIGFRDRDGEPHLMLDLFRPPRNFPLHIAFVTQALIACLAADWQQVQRLLRAHTRQLLTRQTFLSCPAREQLLRQEAPLRGRCLLELIGAYESYWNALDTKHYYDPSITNGNCSRLSVRRTTFNHLCNQIRISFPDDNEEREAQIRQWLPDDVVEPVLSYLNGWADLRIESTPMSRLHLAVRNLFVRRLLPVDDESTPTARTVAVKKSWELRAMFEARHVSHSSAIARMMQANRAVILRSETLSDVIPPISELLPARTMIVFPARVWLGQFQHVQSKAWTPPILEKLFNSYLACGDERVLYPFTGGESSSGLLGSSGHEEMRSLLRQLAERNRSGCDLHFFPDLLDDIPPLSEDRLDVEGYARRLRRRADELAVEQVLWLDHPYGPTNGCWRKPDVNTPDVVYEAVRRAFSEDATDRSARVAVALQMVHNRTWTWSLFYEPLRQWPHGDFAIPGPMPSGLAEELVDPNSQMRNVFGNFDAILVSIIGRSDSDGGGGDNNEPPTPDPSPAERLEQLGSNRDAFCTATRAYQLRNRT